MGSIWNYQAITLIEISIVSNKPIIEPLYKPNFNEVNLTSSNNFKNSFIIMYISDFKYYIYQYISKIALPAVWGHLSGHHRWEVKSQTTPENFKKLLLLQFLLNFDNFEHTLSFQFLFHWFSVCHLGSHKSKVRAQTRLLLFLGSKKVKKIVSFITPTRV